MLSLIFYICLDFSAKLSIFLQMRKKIDATWYKRPPGVPAHLSAGGIVTRLEEGRVYIALIGEKGLTKFVLPKGHVEKGESLEEAARREIAEEAGLSQLKRRAKLGVKERLDFKKKAWKKTHYYLFTTKQIIGKPTDKNHRYNTKWFPLEEFPELFWPEQTALIEEYRQQIKNLVLPRKKEP